MLTADIQRFYWIQAQLNTDYYPPPATTRREYFVSYVATVDPKDPARISKVAYGCAIHRNAGFAIHRNGGSVNNDMLSLQYQYKEDGKWVPVYGPSVAALTEMARKDTTNLKKIEAQRTKINIHKNTVAHHSTADGRLRLRPVVVEFAVPILAASLNVKLRQLVLHRSFPIGASSKPVRRPRNGYFANESSLGTPSLVA